MRKFISAFIFIFLSSVASHVFAVNLDSLLQMENKVKPDEQAELFNRIAREYIRIDEGKAVFYINKALSAADKAHQPEETAQAYLYFAVVKKRQNNLDQATAFYQKVIDSFEKTNDTSLVSKAYTGLAQIKYTNGSLFQAIKYLDKTIELKQSINDLKGSGIAYNTMGNVYARLGENDKAIENYEKALNIFNEIDYQQGVATNLNAIGVVYETLANYNNFENFSEALKYYSQAKDIQAKIGNRNEESRSISNIGNIYSQMYGYYQIQLDASKNYSSIQRDSLMQLANENYRKAIKNYQEAQRIQIEINDIKGYVTSETNLGAFYINSKDYTKALEQLDDALEKVKEIDSPPYLTSIVLYYRARANLFLSQSQEALVDIKKSLQIAKESNIKKTLSEDYNLLTDVYDSLGRYKDALYAHRQYVSLKDSIFNEQTNKLIQEFGKKENERQLELKESQIKQQEAENKQQRLMLYGLGVIIIFVVIFIFLIFRQYRQKKRANEILEAKNLLITQQKQEITDSIQYAQYIQLAVLPQVSAISTMVADHFILFKPRDIVSGDFYWMKELKTSNSLMVTAADCTGHGVPGAFMSLLGISFLNEITSHRELDSPGLILDQLKQKVIESLHQTEEVGSSHDGMDMSFIIINKNEKHVKYAGANNPLYLIRSNEMPPVESEKKIEGETHTLYEIKADKMPIGISHASHSKFTTHTFDYIEGDAIYLFSDGYADQFGGKKYKKMKYASFKQMLLANINLPMVEQKHQIDELHMKWKGGNEQTDDIIVIGIRL